MPEGDGTLLDRTCLLYVHEHAEANAHKNNNLAVIVAGHARWAEDRNAHADDGHTRRSLSDALR